MRRAGGVGLAGGGHDLVAGGAQGGGQDGADATRADDAHPQPGLPGVERHVEPFVPVPLHPREGAGRVPD